MEPTVCVKNHLPGEILMGQGALNALGAKLPEGKALIVTDKGLLSTGIVERVSRSIPIFEVFSDINAEPTTEDLDRALLAARGAGYASVVGVGGGSALDVAKAVAALKDTNWSAAKALGNHPELIRNGYFAAIPTTAGTGSEATLNSIFIDSSDGVKKALISPACLPDTAVLDPELTISLPASITASTGVDALCHCVESLISVNANPFSEIWSRRGIALIERYLRCAVEQPEDLNARYQMLVASFCGGAALAVAGTVAVHALAYPLGKRGIPHGVANSMLFLEVMKFNLNSCAEKLLSLSKTETTAQQVLDRMGSLVRSLPIPFTVREYHIDEGDLDALAEEAMQQTRLLNNNPVQMNQRQARAIYQTLF